MICKNDIRVKIENLYGFSPDDDAIMRYIKWEELFVKYNSHINLMSKNDICVLFEKHVLDSLAITLLPEFKDGVTLLDIGAGGGFPSLILALFFQGVKIIALDSTEKKIKFLETAKTLLGLAHFETYLGRAEKAPGFEADIITSRAVGKIPDVWAICTHHLKKGGLFVSYKARNAKEEAAGKLSGLGKPKFISYSLPLPENPVRRLVLFKSAMSIV